MKIVNPFKKCLVCTLRKGDNICRECYKRYLCDEHRDEHLCPSRYGCCLGATLLASILLLVVASLTIGTIYSTSTIKQYQLSNGKRVYCSKMQTGDNGLSLRGCWDGKEYLHQTNVTVQEKYVPWGATRDREKFKAIYK